MAATGVIQIKSDMQSAIKDFGIMQKDAATLRKELDNLNDSGLKASKQMKSGFNAVNKVMAQGTAQLMQFTGLSPELQSMASGVVNNLGKGFTSLLNPVALLSAGVALVASEITKWRSATEAINKGNEILNQGMIDGAFIAEEYNKVLKTKSIADKEAEIAALKHAKAEQIKRDAFLESQNALGGVVYTAEDYAKQASKIAEIDKAIVLAQKSINDERAKAFKIPTIPKIKEETDLVGQQIKAYEKLYGDRAVLHEEYLKAREAQLQIEADQFLKYGMDEKAVKTWLENEKLNITKKYIQKQTDVQVQATQMMLSSISSAFSDIATLQKNLGKSNKTFLIMAKGVAITESTINSYLAFTKALASAPPPFNYALAAATLAAGMAKVAAIASTPIKAETGIQNYKVPPGYNYDNYPVMAKSGEKVTVTPKGEENNSQPVINITFLDKTFYDIINKGISSGAIRISSNYVARRTRA